MVLMLLQFVLLPILCLMVWWFNEIIYVNSVRLRCSKYKLPPGHLGLPFIGETLSYLWYFKVIGNPDQFIYSKISKYGRNVGVYRSYLYGSPSIIACSPSICKHVLQSTNNQFIAAWPESIVGANSIMTLHRSRHQVIKSFVLNFNNSPDSLNRMVTHIQPNIVAALESWSQMSRFKAFPEMKKVIFDYMRQHLVRCEFGLSTNDLMKLFIGIVDGLRAQPWNLPGTSYHHAVQCRKKLIKIVRDELHERKAENQSATLRNDVMDELMKIKDKEGNSLSDEEVLDNVLALIMFSHTTLSYLMPWTFYFLAKSPHVLQRLQEENICMRRRTNHRYITYEDLKELKYTLKVVEELIRMVNVSSFLIRKVTEDIEYQGYIIPKDWNVIVWLRHLHVDPANFDDPMCFNPDRWDKRPKRGASLSFGAGAKACGGSMVARVNLAVLIHHLSIGYQWKLINPNVPIKYLTYPHPADNLEISMTKI